MELSKIILVLLGVYLIGCGTTAKIYRVVDPREIDKEQLSELQPKYTPRYEFKYVRNEGVDQSHDWWGDYIDNRYEEYSSCVKKKFKKDPQFKLLQDVKIIIIRDSKFNCKYHYGRCSGEYDKSLNIILVARKDFEKEGCVPLLKHEWSHVNNLISTDHGNLEVVKKCTKY